MFMAAWSYYTIKYTILLLSLLLIIYLLWKKIMRPLSYKLKSIQLRADLMELGARAGDHTADHTVGHSSAQHGPVCSSLCRVTYVSYDLSAFCWGDPCSVASVCVSVQLRGFGEIVDLFSVLYLFRLPPPPPSSPCGLFSFSSSVRLMVLPPSPTSSSFLLLSALPLLHLFLSSFLPPPRRFVLLS